MTEPTTFQRILDEASRPDPYPLYAQLRATPVARESDGGYVVSTYREIVALLHDPRVSSDPRNLGGKYPVPVEEMPGLRPAFVRLDPPEHDRLRRLAMRHFGPPHGPDRVHNLLPDLVGIVTDELDALAGRTGADLVDDFAYPFPVTVICQLLGVPREDEPRFRAWVQPVIDEVDPRTEPERLRRLAVQIFGELSDYFAALIAERRRRPADDLLSALATDDGPDGRMSEADLVSTAALLLVAGHETTVNLIANGILTLLRHPDVLDRIRRDPDLVIPATEELLRYEPPVQLLLWRAPLDDIDLAGTTIAKGAPVTLALAAGNRDPAHTTDPDRFDPDRADNQHLGFGGGIHICFGAPLARLEAQVALVEVVRRLDGLRLAADPPPYRRSPILRGPRHLPVEFDRVLPAPPAPWPDAAARWAHERGRQLATRRS
jgi:cytochrome P450